MNTTPYEVNIDFPLCQSQQGLYFIGQTPLIDSTSGNAQAQLANPSNSTRPIYVNAITITNTSLNSLTAEFYLQPAVSYGSISNLVSSTNTALCTPSIPFGTISYLSGPITPPTGAIPIFSRIVPPSSTLVVDGGQIILGKGQALGVYLGLFGTVPFQGVRFAFGWSEQELSTCKE